MPTVTRRQLHTLGGDTILTLGGDNLVTLGGGTVDLDDVAAATMAFTAGTPIAGVTPGVAALTFSAGAAVLALSLGGAAGTLSFTAGAPTLTGTGTSPISADAATMVFGTADPTTGVLPGAGAMTFTAGAPGIGTTVDGATMTFSSGTPGLSHIPPDPPTGFKAVRSADFLSCVLTCDTHAIAGAKYRWFQGTTYRPEAGLSQIAETTLPTYTATGLTNTSTYIFAVAAYITTGTLEGLKSLPAYAQAKYEEAT